jgi:hypothetical protein
MEANPATDSREGVFLPDQIPGPLEIALDDFQDKRDNIISCRTGRITRRGLILVKGPLGPPGSCFVPCHISLGNSDIGHIRFMIEGYLISHIKSPLN